MRVILIGGSSPGTPALIDNLRERSGLPQLEIVLLGRSSARLMPVVRAARLLAAGGRITVSSALVTDPSWPQTFLNADIIVLQARVGGYEARRWDETMPLKYGVCGDQDLGPGGFSNAWRALPQLRQFFVEAQTHAPQAMFLVLSSPVGLLVRLGQLSAPRLRIAGVCELPWTTILEVCSLVDGPADPVEFGYLGLHHMGWIYSFNYRGRDLVAEYAKAISGRAGFPSEHLVRMYSAIPTKYARLHFEQADVVSEQEREPGTRSDYLAEYRDRALAVFERGGVDEIRAILKLRPTPWYSRGVAPFIAAVGGSRVKAPFFLSRINEKHLPEFGENEVLETACDVRDGEIIPRPVVRPIPEELIGMIRQFALAERFAAEAIWRQAPVDLMQALAAHPWTCSKLDAHPALAREIMAGSRRPADFRSSS